MSNFLLWLTLLAIVFAAMTYASGDEMEREGQEYDHDFV